MAFESSTFLNNLLHIAAEQYDFIVGGGGGGLCGGCHRRNLGVGARWANAPPIIFLLKNSFFGY